MPNSFPEVSTSSAPLTWRLAMQRRAMARRYPRLARRVKAFLRMVRVVASLRLPQQVSPRNWQNRLAKEIEASGFFDRQWYESQYPDVAAAGVDPLMHYIHQGWKESRSPHPLFDSAWYLSQTSNGSATGLNPLVHYLRRGRKTCASPHPFFDCEWYAAQQPEGIPSGMNPVEHYLRTGWKEGRDPHPLFDSDWYLEQNPDVLEAGFNPLLHYICSGSIEGRLTIDPSKSLQSAKIAVVIHAFYDDLLDEIISWVRNIKIDYDLFVSVPVANGSGIRRLIEKEFPKASIFETENYGYDVKPFLDLLASGKLNPYLAVCKVHTKRGHSSRGLALPEAWRGLALSGTLASESTINAILTLFQRDPNVCLVGPRSLYVHGPTHIHENESKIQAIFQQFYPKTIIPKEWGFFAGTMFWMRPQLLADKARIINRGFDFKADMPGVDGTMAHALERIFGLIPAVEGLKIGFTQHDGFRVLPDLKVARASSKLENISLRDNLVSYNNLLRGIPANSVRSNGSASSVLSGEESLRISVIVPVFNAQASALLACIESVRRQSHPNWELCIFDNQSDRVETLKILDRYRGSDVRIKIVRVPQIQRSIGTSHRAAEMAAGEYVAFLDQNDLLHRDALLEIARAISHDSNIDLLYTDEDAVAANGERHSDPCQKSDWTSGDQTSAKDVQHMLVIRNALFRDLGGFGDKWGGAQAYDLALRASQRAKHIHHLAKILYHRRKTSGAEDETPFVAQDSHFLAKTVPESVVLQSARKR